MSPASIEGDALAYLIKTYDRAQKSGTDEFALYIKQQCVAYSALVLLQPASFSGAAASAGPGDSAERILKLLRGESSLTLLDLRLNQLCGVDSFGNGEFTCEAVRSLANALDANETLSWLRLEHNAVPRHAAGWMRDVARRRPGLRVSL